MAVVETESHESALQRQQCKATRLAQESDNCSGEANAPRGLWFALHKVCVFGVDPFSHTQKGCIYSDHKTLMSAYQNLRILNSNEIEFP